MASLASALPHCWGEVFTTACYLLSSGDPFVYCDEWLSNTAALPIDRMSSQRISELPDFPTKVTMFK
jgi:hypothetical protein